MSAPVGIAQAQSSEQQGNLTGEQSDLSGLTTPDQNSDSSKGGPEVKTHDNFFGTAGDIDMEKLKKMDTSGDPRGVVPRDWSSIQAEPDPDRVEPTVYDKRIEAIRQILAERADANEQGGNNPEAAEQIARMSSEKEQSLADMAFRQMLNDQVPMTPRQIRLWRKRLDETDRAAHGDAPAKLRNRETVMSLEPGAKSGQVHVVPGYASSVRIIDSTGEPWPVTSVTVGNSQWFDVKQLDLEPYNMLQIQSAEEHADTNMILTLEGHDVPIIVRLVTDYSAERMAISDSLVTIQVEERGPYAAQPLVSAGTQRGSATTSRRLMAYLDGIPPSEAKELKISPESHSGDVRLYSDGEDFVLRLSDGNGLVWPAWKEVTRGSNGVRVYRLPQSPSFMISESGRTRHYKVKDPVSP